MKKVIYTPEAPKAIGAYSQAVEVNGMLFVSGQIALDPATQRLVEGGIVEQTGRVLVNIRNILKEAGYGIEEVVKVTILLKDIRHFAEVNQLYSEMFADNPPARATYEVANLPLGSLLEVDAIAVKSA
ncbi:MAG TPA: RidA family protein [Bacteroidales bacterium]|nr:RidA family protein [Bacteroidales bacterium]HSA43686.1 RidA family protein [Bacteroidales bacterium]